MTKSTIKHAGCGTLFTCLYWRQWRSGFGTSQSPQLDGERTMTRCLMGIAVLAFMAAYWESGRARTAELESAVPQNDAYTVPEGGVAAITDFIRNLAAIRPATVAADIEYRSHYFPALRKAGERLLDLDKDPKSEAHRAGT